MKTRCPYFCLLFFCCWIWTATCLQAAQDYVAAGPCKVESFETEWTYLPRDANEKRKVPVKIYYPAQTSTTLPVIIFSHGLGGSRENYAYLAQHWASHGYLCIHPTHLGSDTSLLRGTLRPMQALRRAAADPQNIVTRPQDISC